MKPTRTAKYDKGMKFRAGYLQKTGYRLPREAECGYANRAGALTSRYYGETEELLPQYAWYIKNSQDRTWPVGSKKPNDFGLFDLHGNVYSWCIDSYDDYPETKGDQVVDDVEGPADIDVPARRGLRGGSFTFIPRLVRSAYRNWDQPTYRSVNVGFRRRGLTPELLYPEWTERLILNQFPGPTAVRPERCGSNSTDRDQESRRAHPGSAGLPSGRVAVGESRSPPTLWATGGNAHQIP